MLRRTPEDLTADLVTTMVGSGAVIVRDGRLHATAEHAAVDSATLQTPFPRAWPFAMND